ncbi:MAG: FCD domain-containing protein [Bacteroidales bacterium]
MIESRETQLTNRLVNYLRSDNVNLGDRLPAERKLAEILETSRNTLRNALKMMQARGILTVKPNSGYYLVARPDSDTIAGPRSRKETLPWISDQLEALILFEPIAVAMAAERMTGDELKSLELCLVNLSKAILENNTQMIVGYHKDFHEIIASGTHNRSITKMLERLVVTYELISDVMHRIEQERRDKLFALHVNLFKAISAKDTTKAQNVSREMIRYITVLLNEFEDVALPENLAFLSGGDSNKDNK